MSFSPANPSFAFASYAAKVRPGNLPPATSRNLRAKLSPRRPLPANQLLRLLFPPQPPPLPAPPLLLRGNPRTPLQLSSTTSSTPALRRCNQQPQLPLPPYKPLPRSPPFPAAANPIAGATFAP